MVVISHRLPSILPALAVGCGRVVRAMARLIARSMDLMAIDRRLSILNDHLLRDIGVDARTVRERARAAELGWPSRSPAGPEIAPGVGTPVKGGLSYREAHLAMELIADADLLTSIEVVEVNPILDLADVTGQLAVELVASVLGARIL